jgi:hypothetical protein
MCVITAGDYLHFDGLLQLACVDLAALCVGHDGYAVPAAAAAAAAAASSACQNTQMEMLT